MLLVQVLEALAKDAEACEAELRTFVMMLTTDGSKDATNHKSNGIDGSNSSTLMNTHKIVPFKMYSF